MKRFLLIVLTALMAVMLCEKYEQQLLAADDENILPRG